MMSSTRLQAYLRHIARAQYAAIAVPPFTLFFHPHDPAPWANYAIPDEPAAGDVRPPLVLIRGGFAARGRRPRLEFVEGFAPDLAPALAAAGFVEEERMRLMLCTPETYRPVPVAPGLRVMSLTGDSTDDDLRAFLDTQRRVFEPTAVRPATDAAAAYVRRGLREGDRAFLARLDGAPVGTCAAAAPFDGLTELAGIATLEPYRRRGIASALTAAAVHVAFEQGVEAALLSAADERAGRVYERVGFRPSATMLAYADREEG